MALLAEGEGATWIIQCVIYIYNLYIHRARGVGEVDGVVGQGGRDAELGVGFTAGIYIYIYIY
jgi:hypothetical protein